MTTASVRSSSIDSQRWLLTGTRWSQACPTYEPKADDQPIPHFCLTLTVSCDRFSCWIWYSDWSIPSQSDAVRTAHGGRRGSDLPRGRICGEPVHVTVTESSEKAPDMEVFADGEAGKSRSR